MTRANLRVSHLLLGLFLTTGLIVETRPTQATFPGRNGKIAFVVQEVFGDPYASYVKNSVYVVNADGSEQQQLLPPSTSSFYSPAWSPGGSKIAFTKDKALWVMNADGTNQTQILSVTGGVNQPAWSPDGTKIVFSTYIDPSDGAKGINLNIVNANGSGLRQLTNNRRTTATDGSPTWSPDGTKIAFSRYPTAVGSTAVPKIYVINADGSGVRQLSDSSGYDLNPDWSPDGSRIVFERWRNQNFTQATIFLMNADGRNVNQLVSGQDPVWAPDGTKIVYEDNQLKTINPDGTGQTQIPNPAVGTAGAVYEFAPSWQSR